MAFKTLSNKETEEMYRLSKFYWKEALRCEKAKAYLGGCVMIGSALETLLILMVNIFPDEAEQTGKVPLKKLKPKALISWDFAELLKVAKAAKWLPSALELDEEWDDKKAQIGDHAEIIRMVRNLAHPARYVKDHYRKRVTEKYLERQFEVALLCRDWLLDRNNRSLLEYMKAKGLM
jgi:hypothetical protein